MKQMQPITLADKDINKLRTVNSDNSQKVTESTVNSINTVNSMTIKEQILGLLEKYGGESEGSAILLAELLKDEKSIPYYTILVREHGAVKLLEFGYQTKEMDELGKIRTSRPVYFQGILRRLGMKTKFKTTKPQEKGGGNNG